MDKKPVYSTVLLVISLQTSTPVSSLASLDFSPVENKALEDTMFSSTVLPPLTTDPMATPDVSPQSISSPPHQTLPRGFHYRRSVFCEIERIVLTIQKRFLQQESIPEGSLFLGEPGCNVSTSNSTHVVLQVGWSNCGTQVETNMISAVVRTILRNDVFGQGIIHHLNIASPIHCVFQNDVLTSSGYTADGIHIWMETPGSTCRTRCHARARSLKAGETIALHRTFWGPLCKSAASDMKREKEAGMGIGHIILIALAVFGFVLGVVTLLIFQYQLKTERYNFRIKSDNFSYQVFYD